MSTSGMATGIGMGAQLGGPWGAAAGGALGALGLFDSGDDPMAEALEQARQDMMAIGLPPDLSYEIALQQFREAGQLSPEQEEVYRQNYSNIADVQEDTTGRDTQIEALNLLKQRGMGLGAEERAAFGEMRDSVQRDAEAKRMQIMQNMAARGQGGSGAELMAALQGAQTSNTRLSQEGDRLGAAAAQNALSAISQSGQLGSQLRSQDYSAEMDKAKALDAMQQFNLANTQAVQQRNVDAVNQAQAANLQNKQNIQNMNVQQANTEKLRQAQAERDYWSDRLKQASGMANIGTAAAGAYAKSPQKSDMQQLGEAAATFGAAYKKDTGNTIGSDIGDWFTNYNTVKQIDHNVANNIDPSSFTPVSDDYGKSYS